eukprot:Mycagemm_TRINITY_DN10331_c1_g2::TRINITY_DN10331_c1_g2_i1::g.449::m.449 type:complete len:177 gc:universal TRINITY_DN10331_c1_g2_i1:61-591(+)
MRRLTVYCWTDREGALGARRAASVMVSRNENSGGDTTNAIRAKRSLRSFRQRSKCNSPAAATMCSPESSTETVHRGSLCSSRLSPSASFALSSTLCGSTATRTIGAADMRNTEKVVQLGVSDKVAVFRMRFSTPVPEIPNTLPAGTSSMASSARPISRYNSEASISTRYSSGLSGE